MEVISQYISGSPATLGVVALSLASVTYLLTQRPSSQSSGPQLPPGPQRDFLIGNLRQFPKDHFYRKFCEWQKEYGDMVSLHLPGLPLVIINSYDVAQDLLLKRSNTTAGRKTGYMVLQLMGLQWSLAFIQPGPHFSAQRKMLRRGIGPQRVGSHGNKVEKSTTRLMLELKRFEGNARELTMKTVGRVVVEVAYGEKMLNSMGDQLLSWNDEQMHLFDMAFVNFWLVDTFNFLRFVPSWFPGAGFQKIAKRATWLSKQIRYVPFEKVKELYKSGEIGHSLATDLLDEFGSDGDVRDALAVLYLAGVDTTTTAITAFSYAMFLFPKIAQKVHEEIIAVTGGDRFLTIADRPNLPYTEAVWKEAFRWNCFAPIGIPHHTTRDEIVNGYLIKAGTLIHYNNGFILSNPEVWGDPEVFRPERFLGPDADTLPNPLVVIFGYGTRVCPGMYLANQSGFHIAASLASLYELVPLEGQSRPNPETVEYTDMLLRAPVDFNCRFIPRGPKAEELLRSSAVDF